LHGELFASTGEEDDGLWPIALALVTLAILTVLVALVSEMFVGLVLSAATAFGEAKMPPKLVGKNIWDQRFEDIRNFEQYLGRNGVVVRKFFLHVSKKERKRRFLERIEDPLKNWKFSSNDAAERDFWDDYMEAMRK